MSKKQSFSKEPAKSEKSNERLERAKTQTYSFSYLVSGYRVMKQPFARLKQAKTLSWFVRKLAENWGGGGWYQGIVGGAAWVGRSCGLNLFSGVFLSPTPWPLCGCAIGR